MDYFENFCHDCTLKLEKLSHLLLSGLESLFLFLKSCQSFVKFVKGLIKITLIALDFFTQITNVSFISIGLGVRLFGVSLKPSNSGHQHISFALKRLHLF